MHEARALPLGFVDRAQHAVEHVVADRVRLALERHDADVVAQVPHAHGVGFEYRRAAWPPGARPAPDRGRAGAGRPAASSAATNASRAARVRALRRVHAARGAAPCRRSPTPAAARLASALPAAMSSAIQPATSLQPAACQVSNGPICQPKPQRIARSTSRALSAIVGQVIRAVVEQVAEDRPQELRLRMRADARSFANFSAGDADLEDLGDLRARLRPRRRGSRAPPGSSTWMSLPTLRKKPAFVFCAERALRDQRRPAPAASRTARATGRRAACRPSS